MNLQTNTHGKVCLVSAGQRMYFFSLKDEQSTTPSIKTQIIVLVYGDDACLFANQIRNQDNKKYLVNLLDACKIV